MEGEPNVFPPSAFTEEDLLWAFGILRSRALPPLDQAGGLPHL